MTYTVGNWSRNGQTLGSNDQHNYPLMFVSLASQSLAVVNTVAGCREFSVSLWTLCRLIEPETQYVALPSHMNADAPNRNSVVEVFLSF